MESFIKKLNALKTALPGNCTLANLAKLNYCFNEYQQIIESLPVAYQPSKNQYQNNCRLLQEAIYNTGTASNSPRDTKYYFKSAVQQLDTEINQQVAMLSAKIYDAM